MSAIYRGFGVYETKQRTAISDGIAQPVDMIEPQPLNLAPSDHALRGLMHRLERGGVLRNEPCKG